MAGGTRNPGAHCLASRIVKYETSVQLRHPMSAAACGSPRARGRPENTASIVLAAGFAGNDSDRTLPDIMHQVKVTASPVRLASRHRRDAGKRQHQIAEP